MARIIFSTLDYGLMINCLQVLGVVVLIGIIDNLPQIFSQMFSRKKKKPDDEDDDDEYEYIRVRKVKIK